MCVKVCRHQFTREEQKPNTRLKNAYQRNSGKKKFEKNISLYLFIGQ